MTENDECSFQKLLLKIVNKKWHIITIVSDVSFENIDNLNNQEQTEEQNEYIEEMLLKDQLNPVENGIYKISHVENKLIKKDVNFKNNDIIVVKKNCTAWKTYILDTNGSIKFELLNENDEGDNDEVSEVVYSSASPIINLFNGSVGISDTLFVKEKISLGDQVLSVDNQNMNLNISGGTISNCEIGSLLLRVFDDEGEPGTYNGREILQTTVNELVFNAGFTINNVLYDRKISCIYTGYIRNTNESTVFYLLFGGFIKIIIDGNIVFDSWKDNYKTETTFVYTFTTNNWVPITVCYAKDERFDSILDITWSSLSNPVRTKIEPSHLAFSLSENASIHHTKIIATNDSKFLSDVIVDKNVFVKERLHGNVIQSQQFVISNNNDKKTVIDQEKDTLCITSNGGVSIINGEYSSASFLTLTNERSKNKIEIGSHGKNFNIGTNTTGENQKGLSFSIGGKELLIFDDTKDTIFNSGHVQFKHNVSIFGHFNLSGDITLSGTINPEKLQIGKFDNVQSLNGIGGQLNIIGDKNTLSGGPHITTYVRGSTSPVFNIASYSHDNISLNFDSFFDGKEYIPAEVGTSCQILKSQDALQFNYFDNQRRLLDNVFYVNLNDGTINFQKDVYFNLNKFNLIPLHGDLKVNLFTTRNINQDYWQICGNQTEFSLSYEESNYINVNRTNGILLNCPVSINGNTIINGEFSASRLKIEENMIIKGKLIVNNSNEVDSIGQSGALYVQGGAFIKKGLHVVGRLTNAGTITAKKFKINNNDEESRLILKTSKLMNLNDTEIRTNLDGSLLINNIPTDEETNSFQWHAGKNMIMSLNGHGSLNVIGHGNNITFSGLGKDSVIFTSISDNIPISLLFKNKESIHKINVLDDSFNILKNDEKVLSISDNIVNILDLQVSGSLKTTSIKVDKISVGGLKINKTQITTESGNTTIPLFSFDNALKKLELRSSNDILLNAINGNGTITLNGKVNICNGKMIIAEDILFNDNLLIDKNVTCKGIITTDKLITEGNVYINGELSISGNVKLGDETTLSNNNITSSNFMIQSEKFFIESKDTCIRGNVEMNTLCVNNRILLKESNGSYYKDSLFLDNENHDESWYYLGSTTEAIITILNHEGELILNFSILEITHYTIGKDSSHLPYYINIYFDEYKNHHIFICLKDKISVNIESWKSSSEPLYNHEGNAECPSGITSNYNKETWSLVYTTLNIENNCTTYGNIKSKNLTVDNVSSNSIRINDTLDCSKIKYIDIFSVGNQTGGLFIDNENITIGNKNLITNSSDKNIGSSSNPWSSLFVTDIQTDSINVNILNIPNVFSTLNSDLSIFMTSLLFKKDVIVTGKIESSGDISTDKILIAKNGISCFADANIDGIVTCNEIKSKKVEINGNIEIFGDVRTTGSIEILNSEPLRINANSIILGNVTLTKTGTLVSSSKEFSFHIESKELLKLQSNGILVKNNLSVNGKTKFFNDVEIFTNAKVNSNLSVKENIILSSIDSKLMVVGDWQENVLLQFDDHSLSLCVPGPYSGIGESNPTKRLIVKNNGVIEIPGSIKCAGKSNFENLRVTHIAEINQLSLSDYPSPIDSVLSISRKTVDNLNLYMCSETGNNHVGMYVDDTDGFCFVMDSNRTTRFTNEGLLETNIISSVDLLIGKNIQFDSGLKIYENIIKYDTGLISLGNKEMLVSNTGGNLSLLAAGKRGILIEGTSGNCKIDGQLYINSFLDNESVKSSDIIVAALNVAGGIVTGGNIYTHKKIIVGGKVTIATTNTENEYQLTLPDALPTLNTENMLISDQQGKLTWKEINKRDEVLYQDISNLKEDIHKLNEDYNTNTYKDLTVSNSLNVTETINCKNIQCSDHIYIGDSIFPIPQIRFGRIQIGTNSKKTLGLKITYEHPLNTNVYNIIGNIVSADDTSLIYACTFKKLTRIGCSVIICVLNDTRWRDTSLYLHYYIMY